MANLLLHRIKKSKIMRKHKSFSLLERNKKSGRFRVSGPMHQTHPYLLRAFTKVSLLHSPPTILSIASTPGIKCSRRRSRSDTIWPVYGPHKIASAFLKQEVENGRTMTGVSRARGLLNRFVLVSWSPRPSR